MDKRAHLIEDIIDSVNHARKDDERTSNDTKRSTGE